MLFRNDCKYRIISVILSGVFLFHTLAYGNELAKDQLRPKMMTSETEGIERVDGAMTRRQFIKVLAGAAIVTAGLIVYSTYNYFSFNKSKIVREKPADYDMRILIDELTIIKTKKMPYEEVRDYCEKIKIRLDNKMSANIAAFGEITHDKYMQNILPYLLNFLTDEDVNGLNCVSTKWEINLVKERILLFLSDMLMDKKIGNDTAGLIIEKFGIFLEYEDNFKGGDALFAKHFPKINPKEVLNLYLRQRADYCLNQIIYQDDGYPPFRRNLASEQLSIRQPVAKDNLPISVVYRFFLLCGTPRYIESTLAVIRQIQAEEVHYVSEEDIDAINELQKLPKDIRKYCVESAIAHNLPPRLLAGSIISNSNKRAYDVRSGIRILKKRGAISEDTEKKLLKKIPNWILKKNFGAKFNDFLAGVIFDGKTTIGITQTRPAWVRRYKGWERFGIDAQELSNREITLKLLEPKYAIEATAKMWSCLIQETKEARESAIRFNKKIELSDYAKEVGEGYLYFMLSVEGYKWMPDPGIFGKEEWIITDFHPVYCDWAEVKSQLEWQVLIARSGILDDKPVKIVTDEEFKNMQKSRKNLRELTSGI